MIGIPKNRKLLAEIKVTLEIDGDRSDRSCLAGLTGGRSPGRLPKPDKHNRRTLKVDDDFIDSLCVYKVHQQHSLQKFRLNSKP